MLFPSAQTPHLLSTIPPWPGKVFEAMDVARTSCDENAGIFNKMTSERIEEGPEQRSLEQPVGTTVNRYSLSAWPRGQECGFHTGILPVIGNFSRVVMGGCPSNGH